MISIPRAIADRYGIEPGWKFEWASGTGPDQLVVRLIPDRRARARRLHGAGKALSGKEGAIHALIAERESEDE